MNVIYDKEGDYMVDLNKLFILENLVLLILCLNNCPPKSGIIKMVFINFLEVYDYLQWAYVSQKKRNWGTMGLKFGSW